MRICSLYRSALLPLALALIPLLAAAPAARAGVAISPLKQELSLRPGEEGKVSLTISNIVRNTGGGPQSMHIEIADVQVMRDGSLDFPASGSRQDSAGKWLAVPQNDITLAPGLAQTIELAVRPPLSAPPGEYYCAVLVTLRSKGKDDAGMVVQYRLASGVFVTIAGKVPTRRAKIDSVEFIWPSNMPPIQSPGAAFAPQPTPQVERPRLELVLQNIGNARFDASGKLLVLDQQSRIVFRTAFTSLRPNIFAGDSRLFEATIAKALPAGKYNVRIDFDYQSNWSQAHHSFPLEILPAQAAQLAQSAGPIRGDTPPVEANPGRISSVMAAGSTRAFAIAISNLSDDALRCAASVDPGIVYASLPPQAAPVSGDSATLKMPGGWIILGSEPMDIPRSSRRAVELRVQVPAGVVPGKYVTSVILDPGIAAFKDKPVVVPVEIEIKGARR